MKDQIDHLKVQLYKFQLYLEQRSAIRLFFVLAYGTIAVIVTLHDFVNIFASTPKILFSLFNLFLILFVLFLDHLHVNIIKANRIELDGRKYLINELISTQAPQYRVSYRREYHEIESDGTSQYRREMLLDFDNIEITWAEVTLATTSEFGTDFPNMILHAACFPESKTVLSRVPLETDGSKMRFAIILRNKLTVDHANEGFQISMKWKDVWKSLVTVNKDDGFLRIEHDTKEAVIELHFPHGYRLADFKMPRTHGELRESEDASGRQYMTYALKDLRKGDVFQYFVRTEKVDNTKKA